MKRFSLSCLAILTGVAALACAGPVGPVSAQEPIGLGAPGAVSGATDADTYTVGVPFHTSAGIQLGKPTTKVRLRLGSLDFPSYVDGTGAGFTFTFNESAVNQPDAKAAAEVSWPVLQNGKDTHYTVTARLGFSPLETEESCKVRDVNGQETSHFHCYLARQGWNYDWDMHITDDRVMRSVEASGSIKAQGSVSLADGKFSGIWNRFLRAAPAVPAGAATPFDAVYESKVPLLDTAYAEFSYILLDNGRAALDRHGYPLIVTGKVQNYRGLWYQGGSWCRITGRDGVVENSGYSCDMVADYAHTGGAEGRVHYFTDFTVKKR